MTDAGILAVGGENLIDHVTREAEVTALPGGSPFNVAMAIGRQGAAVRYVSPISTDPWGDRLAETLTASGVTLTGGRNARPTTMARVTVTDGIPDYRFERDGTAERAITDATLGASIGEAAALHTGSLAVSDGSDADVWERALAAAHDAGRLVSLDPNVRLSVIGDAEGYRARIRRLLAKVHVLKLSDDDLAGLFPGLGEEAALDTLRGLGSAAFVVVTRGADGVSAWLRDTRIDLVAPPVPGLVDTVGAGDTFMATILTGLADEGRLSPSGVAALAEADLRALLRRAGMAAALNCAREGCDPPTRDELDAALA